MRAFAILTLFAACAIPDSRFGATPDAQDDPASRVLAIVASPSALDVDEGASKDLSVRLSQAPSAPLTVSIAIDQPDKLAIAVPSLTFTPDNFDQAQPVSIAGLDDPDTADVHAELTLTAAGVDPLRVATTVHDNDQVAIVASGAEMVQEGGKGVINVHLSAQPPGDVVVTAVLGAGPMTVSPATHLFTRDNYDQDQAFTLSNPEDADTLTQTQTLTLRATNVADKVLEVQALDNDVQGIAVTVNPADGTITEQTTTATLSVSLQQKPSAKVVVQVATTTGQAHVNITSLEFSPSTYAQSQSVVVDGVGDADTANGSDTIKLHATDPDGGGALDRSVAITIKDDDTQALQVDAPTVALTETTTASFNARLAYKPTSDVVVSVTSQNTGVATATPGTLTFTPNNYDQPHTVTVTGVSDKDLATSTTNIKLAGSGLTASVAATVADVDKQVILLSASQLAVTEGTTSSFTVALKYDPGTTVTVDLASSNQPALPIDRASITFTSTTYDKPVPVKVSPPIDANDAAETATVTVSGANAPNPASIALSVVDKTVIQNWGWPTPFMQTTAVNAGYAIAYKVNVGAVANLGAFHAYVPTSVGKFRMALYADAGDVPGTLIAEMGSKTVVDGANDGAPLVGVELSSPTYFVVVRFSAGTGIGYADPGVTGRQCFGNVPYATIDDAWNKTFGNATCATARLFNLWISTYHQ